MSLYAVNKLLFDVNRDEALKQRFLQDVPGVVATYELTDEERAALIEPDYAKLYVLGAARSLLLTHAMTRGATRDELIEQMQEGVRRYGRVKAGPIAGFDD